MTAFKCRFVAWQRDYPENLQIVFVLISNVFVLINNRSFERFACLDVFHQPSGNAVSAALKRLRNICSGTVRTFLTKLLQFVIKCKEEDNTANIYWRLMCLSDVLLDP